MSVPYVYDAGVLIAIDGGDRRMWAIHHLATEEHRRVIIPAAVVGQAWRGGRRQVHLDRFIQSCEVVPVRLELAKAAGVLCGRAGTHDAVDAIVAAVALVFTSDPGDIAELSSASGVKPGLVIRAV